MSSKDSMDCNKKIIQSNGNMNFEIKCTLPLNHKKNCKGLVYVLDHEDNILDKTEVEFNEEKVIFINL